MIAETLSPWAPIPVTIASVNSTDGWTTYEARSTVLTVGAFLPGVYSTSLAPSSRVTITSSEVSHNFSSETPAATSTITWTRGDVATTTVTDFVKTTIMHTVTTSTAIPVTTSWSQLSGDITSGSQTSYAAPTNTVVIPQDYNDPGAFNVLQAYPHQLICVVGLPPLNTSSFAANANGTRVTYGPWGGYHFGPVRHLECELYPELNTGKCRDYHIYSGVESTSFTYTGKRVPFYVVVTTNDTTRQRRVHEIVRMFLFGVLVIGLVLWSPFY